MDIEKIVNALNFLDVLRKINNNPAYKLFSKVEKIDSLSYWLAGQDYSQRINLTNRLSALHVDTLLSNKYLRKKSIRVNPRRRRSY